VIPLTLVLLGMTAVVVLVLLLPLLHAWRAPAERRQYDRAVYRAQLDELARDVARGVIGGAEAQAARVEIERRLLAAGSAPGSATASVQGAAHPGAFPPGAAPPGAAPGAALGATPSRVGSSRALALAAALIIAGGAGLVYLRLGAPGVPDVPFAEQHAIAPGGQAQHVDMADAAKTLAAKLKANPNNAQGWLMYARTEAMLGNWQTSADAYSRAIAQGQTDADVFAGYGEMLVLGTDGIVGPPARAAFASALQHDGKNDVARYYTALADAQAGESRRAIAGWQALAADIPDDSPMREAIGRQVADAASTAGIAAPPLPKGQPAAAASTTGQPTAGEQGPGQDQMAAAENMPPAERDKMVRGMVEKLATELASAPDNLAGWLQLGRAYTVLGDADKAADALDHAARLKPGDVEISMQEVEAILTNRKPDDAIPARAVTLLKQIEAVSPDRPEVLWYLGVVAARAGQRDEAKRDWQRLLPLLPADSEDRKTVVEALQTLDKS
jgi:cytochrome c-type biogenesis protein CcmH